MTRIRIAVAVFVACVSTSAALAETPLGVWQTLPGLPETAETADCAVFEAYRQQAEEAAAYALVDAQTAMMKMAPSAVSDDQGEALALLLDPSLQECAISAETDTWQMIETTRNELSEDHRRLGDELADALAGCGNEMSAGYDACYLGTNTAFQAKARAIANARLGEISLEFAEWRGLAEDCISRRDAAVKGLDEAGIAGPFATQGLSVRTQSWSMVGLGAQVLSELCVATFDLAHAFDVE